MIAAIVIFVVAYLLFVLGRIPNVLIVLLSAMLLVFLGVIGGEEALAHIDLEVILLLGGMMTLAEVVRRTGAFDWAALRSAQLVRGNGFGVLCLMSAMTAIASAFLDNVTVVILAVPITISLCSRLGLNPTPFLLAQVFASNIGGTSTIVGDPPNIIIASAGDIGFVEFFLNVAPASALSMMVLLGLLWLWFRNDIVTSEASRRSVMARSPGDAIKDSRLLTKSMVVFALILAGFLTHGLMGVSPAFVAVAGAGLLVLVSGIDPRDVLNKVEWTTLAFFIGLFILVGGLVETGVTLEIQEWLVDVAGGDERNLALLLLWFSGVASAVVDNIPFTATMVQVVKDLAGPDPSGGSSPLWWALALGADLGGNATVVGASANVVVVTLARARGYPISFMRFFKYGLVISVASLMVSSGYVWLRYYL